MSFTDFLATADATLLRQLANAGFQRVSAGLWNFRKGDDLNVVWLQKHSSKSSFCVSLGIHYAFLPKPGTELLPIAGESLEEPDCEIHLRLTSDPAVKDQWWPIVPEAVDEIAELMGHRGLAIFDSYSLAGPISAMEAKDIEAGDLGLLSSLTKIRACLLLARLHERLGNRGKCIDAAMIGIRLAEMVVGPIKPVGPKKALKDLLKRNEQPN